MTSTSCQHLTVGWRPQVLTFPDRMQTVHWFLCDWCPLEAVVVITDVTLTSPISDTEE